MNPAPSLFVSCWPCLGWPWTQISSFFPLLSSWVGLQACYTLPCWCGLFQWLKYHESEPFSRTLNT
jgi:hypothetical protein